MNKHDIIDRLTNNYFVFYELRDIEKLKSQLTEFAAQNEGLTDEQFYKKVEETYPHLRVMDRTIELAYLSRISSNTNVIKIIAVIYFLLSIVAAIYFYSQLNN